MGKETSSGSVVFPPVAGEKQRQQEAPTVPSSSSDKGIGVEGDDELDEVKSMSSSEVFSSAEKKRRVMPEGASDDECHDRYFASVYSSQAFMSSSPLSDSSCE